MRFGILSLYMSQDIDNNVVERFKKGDKHAFRIIYDTYHQPVYAIALKYLKRESLANDAVHDVFIKLWDYRTNIDANQSLKGFLFTSVKNHVLNMIRDRKRASEKNKKYTRLRSTSENKTVDNLTLQNYRKIFTHCLKKLPKGKRKIFKLKMNKGVSNKQIAEQLDISVNTVKSQYYKASKFIKEELSDKTDLTFE